MWKTGAPEYEKMDLLSQNQVPFFFMIDFLCENFIILKEEDFKRNGLIFDFQGITNANVQQAPLTDLILESFPESKDQYEKGFNIIQNHLKSGNAYLANYTCKTPIKISKSLKEIFYYSKEKYKVFYADKFVFFSPETFIEICDNQILTHPMKGTIDAAKENAEEVLKNDVKEKAEHYTVVDLLRNDLSMVANKVHVDEFQRIDLIRTKTKNLLAMSSEISGELKPKYQGKIGSIMQALLPAGSILGAPKAKTFEIISQAESHSRGFYTGVAGWFDGKNLDSCVMIRFIENDNGKLYFRSGGGITHLSRLADEYQEMKNKIYVPFF